ncbi:nucleoside-diphosphate sugar epimerase/dehydratase [Cytophagales bacterium LB-30]|uniref:Nucleoside-diphosphate sugar epimerase/dehydratase n=1 Tax=Shiella aurantiaca TaxID=3058365 RepID=A0ABT8F8W4_9BACT|nr:nucleoside-diphosphate sugar epimerase/dehydratase [Shiella aurantiaca]MDN4166646.1 nucleoside-diphosphate sugar epimerase/dehydratase [Shiella aurantiaca]
MLARLISDLRILPRWVIIAIDAVLIAISTFIGYLLRFNFEWRDLQAHDFEWGILISVMCGIIATVITKSYAGIIRYTSLQDAFRIIYTSTLAAGLATVVNLVFFYNRQGNVIPFSVIIITYFASLLVLFYYRVLIKSVFDYYKSYWEKGSNVLIYGAGDLGIITKQVIESTSGLRIVGFIEDDERKVGKDLLGIKIYPATKGLGDLLEAFKVAELVIAIKNIDVDRKNEVVDECLKHGVKARVVPPVEKWVNGNLSFQQLKEINIEDLLGRESIHIDDEHVIAKFINKRILVSGAAGSIGSEVVRQLLQYGPQSIVLVDQAESPLFDLEFDLGALKRQVSIYSQVADITNAVRMEEIFAQYTPDIVFHAAAYKHVPLMEKLPKEALLCNVGGTKLLADLSVKYKVQRFIMISTDKAVNPTNVMGASKRIAELYVQALDTYLKDSQSAQDTTSFITTRFGNVLGSNGSVIPLFKKQIAAGGPITVTHPDITRYFMTIPEACRLVLEAGVMGKGGEIFLFDMGKSVKIVDLAKKMVQLSGLQLWKDIEISFTGLREGEKIKEELLANEENTLPTHHPKIMIAKVREEEYHHINQKINLLLEKIQQKESKNQDLQLVKEMKEIVPEFKSNYSRYEVLDKPTQV